MILLVRLGTHDEPGAMDQSRWVPLGSFFLDRFNLDLVTLIAPRGGGRDHIRVVTVDVQEGALSSVHK